jgi:glycosyltransferase involved in cell wall biosynthesis
MLMVPALRRGVQLHILFVATNVPVPPNNGQAIRSLSIIQGLRSIGHELSFISFADSRRPQDLHLLSCLCSTIKLLPRKTPNLTQAVDYVGRIRSLLTFKSFAVERFRSRMLQDIIQDELDKQKYDLILCDGIYALTNVPVTPTPIALNCHNIEHVILKRYAMLERNPLKKYYARLESYYMRITEGHSCHRVSAALVCSELDLELLRMFRPGLPVFVAPNVVDTDFLRTLDSSAPSLDPILLFQGGMDWYPNRDAVEYFARDILPKIRLAYPKAKFIIAGRNPPAQFIEKFRYDPMIEFTGTVKDMRPYLLAATLAIVPLRIGGGTRIKILEASAAGKPVISTTVGAEGLNLEEGKEIILADDPAQFASSVVDLLRDPCRCEALGSSARAAVVERYSQQTLKKSLEAFLCNLAVPAKSRELP